MTTYAIRHDNKTIIDLKKVAYARFYYHEYRTKIERSIKPTKPTVNGSIIYPDEKALAYPDGTYPNETCLERAIRMSLLDIWIPVWKAIMNNGHVIVFTWTKAKAMDAAWREFIFNKNKK